MGERIKKLKKIRIHREGTIELFYGAVTAFVVCLAAFYALEAISPVARHVIFPFVVALCAFLWLCVLNFYRCPIRYFNGDTISMTAD